MRYDDPEDRPHWWRMADSADFVRPDRVPPQTVLNQSWPPGDRVPRWLEHLPATDWIDVEVRAEFELDGAEWIAGRATRWLGRHVCIYSDDPRLLVPWLWLDAADVRRTG
jgi:hypothetical protein